jgi:hypothetical protein
MRADRPTANATISIDADINNRGAILDGMHVFCGDQTGIATSIRKNSAAQTNDVEVC